MGNCCSTVDCKDSAHDAARQPHAPVVNAVTQANANGAGANGHAPLKPVEKLPPQQLQQQQPHENGVEVVTDPLAEDPAPPSSSSSSSSTESARQQRRSPQQRSPSTKSVASGRMQPEGPGPTHTLQIGDYNLRYSYYSKRGYYPEGAIATRPYGWYMKC